MSDFSSVHTAAEIADMRSTIDDIQRIMQKIPFDEDAARQKIYEINAKHPDNKMIWNLFHANTPSGVSIQQASKENLYQDLQWKEFYLEAKIVGKSVDEMRKEWQNRRCRNIYLLKIEESENPNEQAENADPQPDSPEH